MGDISTWNPVDNSNTAAPPDGWPEGQPASSVNNCARAMMGAVRRWYDTVTAQLAGMLPLTGGTLTGTLNAPYLHSTGNVVADVDLGGRDLNISRNVNAGGDLHLSGNTAFFSGATGAVNTTGGPLLYADAANHVYKQGSGNGAFLFQNYAGTNVANLSAAGILSCNTVHATGNVVADVDLGGRDLNLSRNANVTGTVTAGGNITAPAFIGNVSVPANGPVTTGGTVTGGQVTSTGNASVAGAMTAGSVSASSDVTAAGSVTGGSMHCQGTMQVDGQSNLLGPLYVGPGGAWARIDSSGSYNVSGSWTAISGRAAKENIVDYDARGLAEVLALRPVAFNYRPELFGAEEAEKVRYGLVADEVAPVVPEMVGEAVFGGRHLSTLNMGHLNVVFVRAFQDLAAQNAATAARLALLEAEFGATGR